MWKLQRGDEQVQVSVASGALVAVLSEWQVPAMTVYALYSSRRHLSPAVRALLDFLVERFGGVPW